MKQSLVSILGALLAVGLLVLQPGLVVFALGGAAIGALGALVVFRRSHPEVAPDLDSRPAAAATPPSPARGPNRRVPVTVKILVPLALVAAVGLLVAIGLDGTGTMFATPSSDLPALSARLPNPRLAEMESDSWPFLESESPASGLSVAGVPYKGDFEYEESGEDGPHWHVEETIRVFRARFARMSAGELSATMASPQPLSARAVAVRTALGPEWTFAGERAQGRVVAYRRVRDLPVDLPVWPPTREAAIGIGAIVSDSLAVVLVPSNGSKIDVRAPSSLVKETDPPAERRQFGDEDILTVELDGLEDDPDRRVLHLEIAGWIGQTSIYGAVDDLTAWTLVKLLFAGIPGTLVAFFVTRRLKRRYPDTPAAQPA